MTAPAAARLEVLPVTGLPEFAAGDDLAALVADAVADLRDGDILVISSKAVAKVEGRVVTGDRDTQIDKQSVRLVARRGATRIVETPHGFVVAAAGIDASNTPAGTLVLLPEDPDASARTLRAGLRARCGVDVGVVVSDTFGRTWRTGQTDVALGVAGLAPLLDLRGERDRFGNELEATVIAVADEVAGAADLVKGKLADVPAAVVRGLAHLLTGTDGPGGRRWCARRPRTCSIGVIARW